jgi:NADP-dependent 3-hydroxy acid dehydrogenase YdfG
MNKIIVITGASSGFGRLTANARHNENREIHRLFLGTAF